MAEMLSKVSSGAGKQIIKPNTWTLVKYAGGKEKFNITDTGIIQWISFLRIDFPKDGTGNVFRGKFIRYPGTAKADETGHNNKNTYSWGGRTEHLHFDHTFVGNPKMPVGFAVWHNGTKDIVLDGRQIKAVKVS